MKTEIEAFVAECLGQRALGIEALAAGLGHRSFFRVKLEGEPRTLIARWDPPEGRPQTNPEPPLEPLRTVLEEAGLPVPKSFGHRRDGVLDLLEDVGSESLETRARHLSRESLEHLYARVLSDLAPLQRLRDPGGLDAFRRTLDADLLDQKARLFATFSLGPNHEETARAAFAWISQNLEDTPRRLAHRDFQSQNVFIQEGPGEEARPRWIDFQGAFLAPPEYDAVCLLHDSYVELDPDSRLRLLEGLRILLPDSTDAETCRRRFDLLTLVRKGKDHARFLEAARLRGDRRYLKYRAPTWRSVRYAAERVAPLDPTLERLWDRIQEVSELPCEQ